jgi:hypothetical protein
LFHVQLPTFIWPRYDVKCLWHAREDAPPVQSKDTKMNQDNGPKTDQDRDSAPGNSDRERLPGGSSVNSDLRSIETVDEKEAADAALNEALEDSFPSSDPISITSPTKPGKT